MTKDEIFNKHSFSAIGAINTSKDFCLKAMDEYAKQHAIALHNYLLRYAAYGDASPEFLYDLFIEQQNKDNDK